MKRKRLSKDTMETKKCNKCSSEFPLTRDFFWRKCGNFTAVCIPCSKEMNKLRYSQNQERYLQEKKDYSSKNKEAIKERNRNQYLKNREKRLEYQKNYIHKNKQILRPKIAARAIKKYHSDLHYKIKSNLANRIWQFFKKGRTKTMDFVGCSTEELKVYLESKFTEGMSWSNYGKGGWHIDHIKPCSKFDLSDPEQQKQCFHYTNLQPLWAIDNIKKSNKWEPPVLSSGEVR